jgi:hypothetical protein
MSNTAGMRPRIIEHFAKHDQFIATPFFCHERLGLSDQHNILDTITRSLLHHLALNSGFQQLSLVLRNTFIW